MDPNELRNSSDWEAFFNDFDARLPSNDMSSQVEESISPDISVISSFDSPIDNITNGNVDMVAPNSSISYLSFDVEKIPSGPPFYPFTTGPPSFVHMQMNSTAPLAFQSNIWFPPSDFVDEVTVVSAERELTEVPLPAPPAEVTPQTSQTVHHPASHVAHLLNTYFQLPSHNDLWVVLQTIVSSVWYLTNTHEPSHGVKRSIFLDFLAHRPHDPVYTCLFDDCSEAFPRQDRALSHIRKHFDYRPFVCTGSCAAAGCEERFYCRSYLKTHLTRQKVSCSACSTRLYPQNMTRHLKTCPKLRNTRTTNTTRQTIICAKSRVRRL